MASSTGIFELTAIAAGAIQSDDVLAVVDVHDATQAPQGSTRKVTLANLYNATTAVTVSTPLPNIAQTWNAVGVAFTAVKLNVTNTASAAGSLLIDLQVGGVSQFSVGKAGAVAAVTGAFSGAVSTGALTATTGAFSGTLTANGLLSQVVPVATNDVAYTALFSQIGTDATLGPLGFSVLSTPSATGGNRFVEFRASDNAAFRLIKITNALTVGAVLTVSAGGATITGNSTITGTLGGLTGLTVASGGITVTGNSTITGTLGGLTGLTVASGGAAITGNSTITGTLGGLTGLTVASGAITISAAASKLVPGATSLSLRNSADSADNVLISDAGLVTVRAGVTVTTGNLTFSAASAKIIPGATSMLIRDAADANTNVTITDAGAMTVRSAIASLSGVSGTGLTASSATVNVPGGSVAALTATASWTSGAAAQTGTLTNAPSAGNPAVWIKFTNNGVNVFVPAWT